MNLLRNLQDIISTGASGATGGKGLQGVSDMLGGANLQSLLGPAALGGLVGALLTSKAARGIAGGALLAGGGAMLWNKYKDRLKDVYANDPDPALGGPPAAPELRARRLVRALVFAAKSDGHIDEKEQRAITTALQQQAFGPEAEQLVQEALAEPLDPKLIADGVKNEEEALEVYTLSCAVIDADHFMERSYLDALALALKIPADLKDSIEKNARPAV